jgi:hypothetical protein
LVNSDALEILHYSEHIAKDQLLKQKAGEREDLLAEPLFCSEKFYQAPHLGELRKSQRKR